MELRQGKEFDSYDLINSHCSELCNVETQIIKSLKIDDDVKIDFDGDGKTFWSGIVEIIQEERNKVEVYII